MHLNAQPPEFAPVEHWHRLDKISKAAWIDIAWDYATRCVGEDQGEQAIADELLKSAAIICGHRKAAAKERRQDDR